MYVLCDDSLTHIHSCLPCPGELTLALPLPHSSQESGGERQGWALPLSFPHLLRFWSTLFSSGGLPSSRPKGSHGDVDICLKEKSREDLTQKKKKSRNLHWHLETVITVIKNASKKYIFKSFFLKKIAIMTVQKYAKGNLTSIYYRFLVLIFRSVQWFHDSLMDRRISRQFVLAVALLWHFTFSSPSYEKGTHNDRKGGNSILRSHPTLAPPSGSFRFTLGGVHSHLLNPFLLSVMSYGCPGTSVVSVIDTPLPSSQHTTVGVST